MNQYIKYNLILMLFASSFLSCCVNLNKICINGEYKAISKNSYTIIKLTEEGCFSFRENNFGAVRFCDGVWERIDRNKILITCIDDSDDILRTIVVSYIDLLEEEVIFINSKKIKMNKLILKKQ